MPIFRKISNSALTLVTALAFSPMEAVFFLPHASAGLNTQFKGRSSEPVKPSYTLYSGQHGDPGTDNIVNGFSRSFVDALIQGAENEDIAITVRRVRAMLKSRSDINPDAVDLLSGPVSLKSSKGPKKALLVAVKAYRGMKLISPARDARKLEMALQALGYEATLLIDPSKDELVQAVAAFAGDLKDAGFGLFYFSGFSFEDTSGTSYLLGSSNSERDVSTQAEASEEAIPFTDVHDTIAQAIENAVFVLDISRDDPFSKVPATNLR